MPDCMRMCLKSPQGWSVLRPAQRECDACWKQQCLLSLVDVHVLGAGGGAEQPWTQDDEVLLGTQVECDHGVLASQVNGALQLSPTASPQPEAGRTSAAPRASKLPSTTSTPPLGASKRGCEVLEHRRDGDAGSHASATPASVQPVAASGDLRSGRKASTAQPEPGGSAAVEDRPLGQRLRELFAYAAAAVHRTSTPSAQKPSSHEPLSNGTGPTESSVRATVELYGPRLGDPSSGLDPSLQVDHPSLPSPDGVPPTTAEAGLAPGLQGSRQDQEVGPLRSSLGHLRDIRPHLPAGHMAAHPAGGSQPPSVLQRSPGRVPIGRESSVPMSPARAGLPFPQAPFSGAAAAAPGSAQQAASLQQPGFQTAPSPTIGRLPVPTPEPNRPASAPWQFRRQPVTGPGPQHMSAEFLPPDAAPSLPPSAFLPDCGAAPGLRHSIGTYPTGGLHGSPSFQALTRRCSSLDPHLSMGTGLRSILSSNMSRPPGVPSLLSQWDSHAAIQPPGACRGVDITQSPAVFPQLGAMFPVGGPAHFPVGIDPLATPLGTAAILRSSPANAAHRVQDRLEHGSGRRIGSVEGSVGRAWRAAPPTFLQPPDMSSPHLGHVFPPPDFTSRPSDGATSSPSRSVPPQSTGTSLPLNGTESTLPMSGARAFMPPAGASADIHQAARDSPRVIGTMGPPASRPPQAVIHADAAAAQLRPAAGSVQPLHQLWTEPLQAAEPGFARAGALGSRGVHAYAGQAGISRVAAAAGAGAAEADDSQQDGGHGTGPVGFTQEDDAEAVAWGLAQPSLAVRSPHHLHLYISSSRPMLAAGQQQSGPAPCQGVSVLPRATAASPSEECSPVHGTSAGACDGTDGMLAQPFSHQQHEQQGPAETRRQKQKHIVGRPDLQGSPCGHSSLLNEAPSMPHLDGPCHARPAGWHEGTPVGGAHRPPTADAESRSQQRQPHAPVHLHPSHPVGQDPGMQPEPQAEASAIDLTGSDMPAAGPSPGMGPQGADAASPRPVRRLPASMLRPLRHRASDAAQAPSLEPQRVSPNRRKPAAVWCLPSGGSPACRGLTTDCTPSFAGKRLISAPCKEGSMAGS